MLKIEKLIEEFKDVRKEANIYFSFAYDDEPNKPSKKSDIDNLEKKTGKKLPKDYRRFLEMHNGWHDYDISNEFLNINGILNILENSVSYILDEVKPEMKEKLENALIIGANSNGEHAYLFYDYTKKVDNPKLIEYDFSMDYKVEYKDFTSYIKTKIEEIKESIKDEKEQMKEIASDWENETRIKKDKKFFDSLKKKIDKFKLEKYIDIEEKKRKELINWLGDEKKFTEEDLIKKKGFISKNWNDDSIKVYLGLELFIQYVPTKNEILEVYDILSKYFPWGKKYNVSSQGINFPDEVKPSREIVEEKITIENFGNYGVIVYDEDRYGERQIFNFKGGYGKDLKNNSYPSYLQILLPIDSDTNKFFKLVKEICDKVPFSHGIAGYLLYSKEIEGEEFYNWSKYLWGIETTMLKGKNPMKDGIQGVSWLNIINSEVFNYLKSKHKIEFSKGVKVLNSEYCTIIKAGKKPTVGDIRKKFPNKYAEVSNALSSLMSDHRRDMSLFNFFKEDEWVSRFKNPDSYAKFDPDFIKLETGLFEKPKEDSEDYRNWKVKVSDSPKIKLGSRIGWFYASYGKSKEVCVKVTHPEIEGKTISEWSTYTDKNDSKRNYISWKIANEKELIPGNYHFEVFYKKRKVMEHTFDVKI